MDPTPENTNPKLDDPLLGAGLPPAQLGLVLQLKDTLLSCLGGYYQARGWDGATALELANEIFTTPGIDPLITGKTALFVASVYAEVGIPIEGCLARLLELRLDSRSAPLVEQHFRGGCRIVSFLPELVQTGPVVRELYRQAVGGLSFDTSLHFLSNPKGFLEDYSAILRPLFLSVHAAYALHGQEATTGRIMAGRELACEVCTRCEHLKVDTGELPIQCMDAALYLDASRMSLFKELIDYFFKRASERGATPREYVAVAGEIAAGLARMRALQIGSRRVDQAATLGACDAIPEFEEPEHASWYLAVATELRTVAPRRLSEVCSHLALVATSLEYEPDRAVVERTVLLGKCLGSKITALPPRLLSKIIASPLNSENTKSLAAVIDKSFAFETFEGIARPVRVWHYRETTDTLVPALASFKPEDVTQEAISKLLSGILAAFLESHAPIDSVEGPSGIGVRESSGEAPAGELPRNQDVDRIIVEGVAGLRRSITAGQRPTD